MNTQISIHALREEGDVEVSDGKGSTSLFLSTPSARRATRARAAVAVQLGISIHALREEGDMLCVIISNMTTRISIHALREEGDGSSLDPCKIETYFYPRPPRGGRPLRFPASYLQSISIHALREEGDC